MDIINEIPPALLTIIQTTTTHTLALASTFRTLFSSLLTNPDLPTLLASLLILLISLKLLDMLRRAVLFWVSLLLRLVFWGSIGVLILRVYTKGVEQTFGDIRAVVEFWWAQYEVFKKQAERSETVRRQGQYAYGGYGGYAHAGRRG